MISIPIKFRHDLESETQRVKETFDNLEWLNKNNYRFLLPEKIETTEGNVELIRKLVENEYNPEIYEIAENAILKSWEGNSESVKKINQKMIGSNLLNDLTIILTRYGTQGSYITPNSAIINISTGTPPEFLIKTVIHESLHLMIQHLINKYSVEHWVKEHIVDLIMNLEYKSRFKMQPVPGWVLSVDSIFEKNYPNLDLITEEAAEISPPIT